MKAYERFLKYVTVWTSSDEDSTTVPTTKRQLDLGNLLVEEMNELGLSDVKIDEYGYVYGISSGYGRNGRGTGSCSDRPHGYCSGL